MKTKNKLTKGIATVCLSFLFCSAINAQDILTLMNGDELTVKVLEVTETEIKYRNYDSPNGPYRFINKTDAFSVKYENGTKDIFKEKPVKIINNNTGPVYQNNTGPVKQIIVQQPEPADKRFDNDSSDFAKTRRKRFGGPRIGATYLGPGLASDYMVANGKQPIITQFGWQFEGRLFTTENGTQGLIEFVPLIGGIEQGIFIPSASLLLGIRGGEKRIFEFGIGPNFSMARDYKSNAYGSFGVVIAVGTSFKSGNIYFPVTLAFVPTIGSKVKEVDKVNGFYNDDLNKTFYDQDKVSTGFKFSLLVGFNYRKK